MLRTILTVLGAAFVALHAVPAGAQTVCGERAKFLTHLDNTYSEHPVAIGLTSSGEVLEVLTSTSGTWTFLVTNPSGRTCIVASGEGWETLPVIPAGQIS